ncbi:MAG: histidine--tRNA ligase [Candidatus Azosocius agrarius]|nr:MAG: histidine--tRNA ligase [Gammaproteobacteria bacterium]
MFNCIFSVKGMNDVLPNKVFVWQYIEDIIRKLMISYGYVEIRFPIVEKTILYLRSIGEGSDILEKEMYSFKDKNNVFLSLRPEGTVGCARMVIENGLVYNNKQQKLWYIGPMFRRENTQKGRYRQFHQFGIEAFGYHDIDIDVEQILIIKNLFTVLNVNNKLILQINCIGSLATRSIYKNSLFIYFSNYITFFDEDDKNKLLINPILLLDSKKLKLKKIIKNAPKIINFLDEYSKNKFFLFLRKLINLNINFILNENLVRGLDYYNDIVYEWIFENNKSQNSLCGGGRYDRLISQLGFKNVLGVGFGIGMERLISLYNKNVFFNKFYLNLFLICIGEKAQFLKFKLSELIRLLYPNIFLCTFYGINSYTNQLKKAYKSNASLIFIIGDNELKNYDVKVKFLNCNFADKIISINNINNLWRNFDV